MRTGWIGERNCAGCRYWSEMIAQAGGGTTNPRGDLEAMCLGEGPFSGKYTTAKKTCDGFARDTHGPIDDPYAGEEAMAAYAEQADAKHANGRPKFAPDGTMMDENGNRSIFDDVDF